MARAKRDQFVRLTGVIGTLDELEPILRDQGYVAVKTAAGVIDLAQFNPYGMRRISDDVDPARHCQHVYRGRVAWFDSRPYLADAAPERELLGGMFPLLTREEIGK